MESDGTLRPFILGVILMMFGAFALGLAVGIMVIPNEYVSVMLLSVSVIITFISLRMIKGYANKLTLKE
jgi:hypothetical protein